MTIRTTLLQTLPMLAGWWLLAHAPASGQMPKLPGGISVAQPTSAKPAPTDAAATVQSLTRSLAENRKRASQLEGTGAASIPPEITQAEVADFRSDLVRTIFNQERHLKSLESVAPAQATADEARRREQEWHGFKEKPPYSFLFYDELRNQHDAAISKLESFKSTVALIERQIAGLQDQYREAEQAAQLVADKAARAKGTAAEPAAMWRLEATTAHLQAAGSSLAFYRASITTHQPRIAAAEADLALIERQLAAVGSQVSFTEDDLATATANARTKSQAVEKDLIALAKRQNALLAERDELRAEVDNLRAQPAEDPAKADPRLGTAEAKLRAINAEEETVSFSMDLLGASLRLYADTPVALKLRRALFTAPTADERLRARKKLLELQASAKAWRSFIDNERAAVAAAVREQESRLAALATDSPDRVSAQRVLAAQLQKNTSVDQLDQLVNNCSRSIDRWVADDTDAQERRSLGRRAADGLSRVWSAIGDVWTFPVYTYTDTVELNGQKVDVKRGLSLGWLLGALLFFIISYRLTAIVAKRIQKTVVQQGWAGEAQTRTLRRWTMVAVGALLALFTLHLLKIPLTAFAFLGGALAIGFGFGTQTIFKNLISGIIVLAERKIKVGDILDIDGIIGRVASVDTRSSTLRGFDGVETLIPNSLLLENKVTNWTHSNARQRRVVRVGVAYGSPLARVSEIMAECASRHGLILSDPAPLVLFEDFGPDSLLFALYFWVELKDNVNANQIASDLRFMFDKRFTEGGIVIAFPQRDLHLSAAAPLPVRMVPPDPPDAADAAATNAGVPS